MKRNVFLILSLLYVGAVALAAEPPASTSTLPVQSDYKNRPDPCEMKHPKKQSPTTGAVKKVEPAKP
jgi:hypothetical protein